MQLIGMLDSPYVRRVAISMTLMGLAFAAFSVLEDAAGRASPWLQGAGPNASDIVTAVAWRFGQYYNADLVPAWKYPALARFSVQAEALEAFASTPLD